MKRIWARSKNGNTILFGEFDEEIEETVWVAMINLKELGLDVCDAVEEYLCEQWDESGFLHELADLID
jgi:hypothetical protein